MVWAAETNHDNARMVNDDPRQRITHRKKQLTRSGRWLIENNSMAFSAATMVPEPTSPATRSSTASAYSSTATSQVGSSVPV